MLSQKDKKRFRSIGHQLKPIVTVAEKGLSDAVLAEAVRALDDHELIKVKVSVGERSLRDELIKSLCETTKADLVQSIGNVALIYRPADKPNPNLSNLVRFAEY